MSGTLKVTTLQDGASATPNIVLDSSGNATVGNNLSVTGTTALTGNVTAGGTVAMASSFKRNRFINGNMAVAQRGTTATGTYSSVFQYVSVDRWCIYSANTSTTFSQSTNVPTGFQYSLKVQRPSGNAGVNGLIFAQAIESVNCYDLSSQSVTLSFWAKAGANYSGGALTVQIVTGTVADQGIININSWTGGAYAINSTASINTTWTRYTFTGTVGAGILEAAAQLFWVPTGTAGADDAVYITGVQLEVGTIATPYERQIYSDQLAQCQRYLPAFSGNNWFYGATASSSTTGYAILAFPVPSRVPPTGFVVNNPANFTLGNLVAFNGTVSSLVFNSAGTQSALINPTCNAGLSTTLYTTMWGNSSALIYFTGCEL